MGVLDERPSELGERVRRADRVARDDRDAADDTVGEERRLAVVEEVRLVGAKHERRQRVDAPRVHERARQPRARAASWPTRCRHGASQPATTQSSAATPSSSSESGNQSPKEPARCGEPPHVQPEQAAQRLAEREPERERLVGCDPVEPERGERVRRDRAGSDSERAPATQPSRRRVARPVEVVPAGDQQDEHDRRCERPVVEAVQHVQRGRERRDRRRDLPGAAAAPREPARRDEQRDADERSRRPGQRPDGVGRERVQEARVVAGQHRVQRGSSTPPTATTSATTSGARRPRRARRAMQRDRERDERGGQVDRLQTRGGVERVAQRDLADDGDRDAGSAR